MAVSKGRGEGGVRALGGAHFPIPGTAALPASPGRSWVQSLFLCGPKGQRCASPNTQTPPLPLGPAHPFGQTAMHSLVVLGCTQSMPCGKCSEAPAPQGHSPSGPQGAQPWPLAVSTMTGHARHLQAEGTLLGGMRQVRAGVGKAVC